YPLPTSPQVSSHLYCPQSLVIPVLSAVSGHPCAVRSLWSSLCCPQSLVISCTVSAVPVKFPPSAVSDHPLHCLQSLVLCTVSLVFSLCYVRSPWSSPVLRPQSLVISCATSAVPGHLLCYVRSPWSSPVLRPQSLVISCATSAVSGHLLCYVRS
ncbi:unnamed protein product, partial [Staurois parvus]